MHEVDMTRCLLLSMQEWRQQHQPQTPEVSRVHLEVGAFTCVEPDALQFTYGVAVKGSWLEGSDLQIATVPLRARCLSCQASYAPDPQSAYRSPCCDQPMEEILSGRELRIRSIDYVLPPADNCVDSSALCPAKTPTPSP